MVGPLEFKNAKGKWVSSFCVLEQGVLRVYEDATMQHEAVSTNMATWRVAPRDEKKDAAKKERFRLVRTTEKATGSFDAGAAPGFKDKELLFCAPSVDDAQSWTTALDQTILQASPTVFGIPLRFAVLKSGWRCPAPVKRSIDFMKAENAVSTSGIFRISSSLTNVQQVKEDFDTGREPNFSVLNDPQHVAANVIKLYLRELPDPLLTYNLYDSFIEATKTPDDVVPKIRDLVKSLPWENKFTLQFLLDYLTKVVDNSVVNLMTVHNVGVVFGPSVLRSREEDIASFSAINFVIETLITHYSEIFSDILADISRWDTNKAKASPRVKRSLSRKFAAASAAPAKSFDKPDLRLELAQVKLRNVVNTAPQSASPPPVENTNIFQGVQLKKITDLRTEKKEPEKPLSELEKVLNKRSSVILCPESVRPAIFSSPPVPRRQNSKTLVPVTITFPPTLKEEQVPEKLSPSFDRALSPRPKPLPQPGSPRPAPHSPIAPPKPPLLQQPQSPAQPRATPDPLVPQAIPEPTSSPPPAPPSPLLSPTAVPASPVILPPPASCGTHTVPPLASPPAATSSSPKTAHTPGTPNTGASLLVPQVKVPPMALSLGTQPLPQPRHTGGPSLSGNIASLPPPRANPHAPHLGLPLPRQRSSAAKPAAPAGGLSHSSTIPLLPPTTDTPPPPPPEMVRRKSLSNPEPFTLPAEDLPLPPEGLPTISEDLPDLPNTPPPSPPPSPPPREVPQSAPFTRMHVRSASQQNTPDFDFIPPPPE
eukprot:TRINITY_DN6175_c0_g1_i1.p1 TRINITY_DN6175_c0_g1~~TRINITY_DN6175_c0_g1_i1.p1  ORF type:complete len:820 (+),score=184.42 TRINITY_DN6175_c0_g1_i1:170-2461(+)